LLLDAEFLRDEADQQPDLEEPRFCNRTLSGSGPETNTEGDMHVSEAETIASQKPMHSVGFRNDIDDVLGSF
jgi:hypothetical protein